VDGRTSARYERPSALPHLRLRPSRRTSTVRGVAAAVVAVAALITAANAVPAHASQPPVQRTEHPTGS
jgi:hypothetical protein